MEEYIKMGLDLVKKFQHELITYGIFSNFLMAAICISVMVLAGISFAYLYKAWKNSTEQFGVLGRCDAYLIILMILGLLAALFFAFCVGSIETIFKCLFAPNVYLVDYLKGI